MTPKKQAYEVTASTIIKNLAKRRMEGFYCPDSRSAVAKALELMPKGCSIAWGGSATVQQTGLMEAIRGGSYQIIDRDEAKTPEEKRVMFSRIVMADDCLMSANAITLDGQLMNIDGNGNRVGPLCYGPEHVLVVAGMNKVVTDIHEGVKRIRAMACPANAIRLGRRTPCAVAGVCGDCKGPESMCSQLVIVRRCQFEDRIKVIRLLVFCPYGGEPRAWPDTAFFPDAPRLFSSHRKFFPFLPAEAGIPAAAKAASASFSVRGGSA